MKNILIIAVLLLKFTTANSQNAGSGAAAAPEMSSLKTANLTFNIDPFGVYDVDGMVKGMKYADISGTPFVFGDWRKATIFDLGLHPIATIKVKYNSYSDQIHFLDEKETELVANKDIIKKVVLLYDSADGSKEIVLEKGFTDSKSILRINQFVQVLNDGKVQLFKQNTTKIIQKDSLFATLKVNTFSENKFYFLKYTPTSVEKLRKLDQSELHALLPNKAIIEAYSKKKSKLKNEKDFIDFLNFYNQQVALLP
jgi:hypothetical protein